MYATVSIGGTMPPSRFGTIPRFNTHALCRGTWVVEVQNWPIDSQGRISASYITRPTDQCHCLSMEAGKLHGRLESPNNTGTAHFADYAEYRPRKSGPGVLTRMALIGATHSRTTIAPMSSCKRLFRKSGDVCIPRAATIHGLH